jgi:hypothetical protein
LYTKEEFKKVSSIVSEFACSTTASTANGTAIAPNGKPCTVHCTVGNIWVNPLTTATTNSFKMGTGMVLDMLSTGTISVVSDSTAAKAQAIIWEA